MYIILLSLFIFVTTTANAVIPSTIIDELNKIQQHHNIPFYSVIISDVSAIQLQHEHYLASIPFTPIAKPYIRLGSITKTFVALGALVAAQQNKLLLHQPIKKYLPKTLWHNTFSTAITTQQLLEHTAGFTDMSAAEFAHNTPLSLQQALKQFQDQHQTLWSPGLHHSYSNTGYGFAGRVIEVATQQSLEQWLQHAVFTPLKMASATLHPPSNKSLIPGFDRDGKTPIPYWHTVYSALGAMNVNVVDMAKLLQFLLNKEHPLLSPTYRHYLFQPRTGLTAKYSNLPGYASGLRSWWDQGYRFYGHGGDADGYLTHYAIQPESGLGYFVVINSFNYQAISAMETVLQQVLLAKLPQKEEPSVTLLPSSLQQFVGNYHQESSRFGRLQQSIRIKIKNNQLFIYKKSWKPLVAVGKNTFRYQRENHPSLVFIEDQHRIFLHTEFGNFKKQS